MKATIKDVAEASGLSVATVSKYLNGATLKERNRVAVEKAIRRLGYRKNDFARSLKTNRSMAVGVLLPDIGSPFHSSITHAIEGTLYKAGYSTIICNYVTETDKPIAIPTRERIEFLLGKGVDGIALFPLTGVEDLFSAKDVSEGVPIVLVDAFVDGAGEDSVMVDHEQAARIAVRYLLDRGHRRIAGIFGPRNHYSASERANGYINAFKELGLKADSRLMRFGKYFIEDGCRMAREILLSPNRPTALFATNQELTIGAVEAIRDLGIRVPDDVSFIGFDDSIMASVFSPKLTIVAQPLKAIGEEAAKLLIRRMHKESSDARDSIRLNATLIERESVKTIAR